jgi:hypothetical protein
VTGAAAGITRRAASPVVPPGDRGTRPGLARSGRNGLCAECGAAGTHYLTCKPLRLPSGYRLSARSEPGCLCGLGAGTCGACAS